MTNSRSGMLSSSSIAVLVVGLAAVGWLGWNSFAPQVGTAGFVAQSRAVDARGDLDPEERAQIELFRAASPSVAHITTRAVAVDRFSMRATEVPSGTGSGFVWDDRGYIVTNFHVIANARSVYVTLDSHDENFEAEVVGFDSSYDVAVLRIEAPAKSLRPVPIGNSKDLLVGQKTFAIGNPFGLDHTLSTGVVSGLDREITAPDGSTIRGVIQTDAAINPGNSGGPLLDSAGRLIGMNTAIATMSGSSAGIGFAVPVDTINRIVPRMMRGKRPPPPRLGIVAAPGEVARMLRVEGVVVREVDPSMGAAAAGLRSMEFDARGRPIGVDVIKRVAGEDVRSLGDLTDVLSRFDAGDSVEVDYERGDEKKTVKIRLTGGA